MRMLGELRRLAHSRDREAWLAARRQYVCGSDVARMLCCAPSKDPAEQALQRHQLRMEKAGLAEEWQGDENSRLASVLEKHVIDLAREVLGWVITEDGWLTADPVCSSLAATPDAIVETPFGPAAVNIKITACSAQEDCKPRKGGLPSEAKYADGLPLYYQLQSLAEQAVTGTRLGGMLVLHHADRVGLKLRGYYVPWHEGAVARIRREADAFMREVEALKEGRLSA